MKLRRTFGALAFLTLPLVQLAPYCFPGAAVASAPKSERIDVSVSGRGSDVILVPGLASSGHVWDATVAHLKAHHRVHVVQVAGFGGAPAGPNAQGPVLGPVVADLHEYIARNHLAGAAVIGHSVGGLMVMKLAIDHPADVGRVMIVDSLPFLAMMYGPDATVEGAATFAQPLRDKLLAGTQEAYASAEPAQMARLIKTRNAEAEAAITAASASDHRVVAQVFYEDSTTDLRAGLPGVKVPVTALYPWDPSTGAPQAAYDRLYTGAFAPLKQAKVKRIDGSFHFIMIDQPQVFLHEVDGFLAS